MASEDYDPEIAEEEKTIVTDLSSDDVVTKYKTACEIINKSLAGVITQCTEGKLVIDICVFGDTLISGQCATVFKSKKLEKGIAFPTCISINEVVGHNSPLKGDNDRRVLKTGDVVKIDMGCHIDGYIATVAHTLVVGATKPITGKTADILQAAHICSEVAHKLIRPGNTNTQVTKAIAKVCETFGVSCVQGVLSHQLKQFVIDGNKVISLKDDAENKVDEITFEANEVYAMDIVLSTGEGKPKQGEERTTVFKRAVDQSYRLKMKSSRYVFNEVNKNFPTLPFTLRAFDDEKQARMGVSEMVNHKMLVPYPVILENKGDIVVHFKFNCLLMPSGTDRATGGGLYDASLIKCDIATTEETNAILALSSKKKKKKKKSKKKTTEA